MPISATAIFGAARSMLPYLFRVIDQAVEDKDKANEIKATIQTQVLTGEAKELEAARDVIIAEAKGESWLQRSWRPLLMLTFGGMLVARWLGLTADIPVEIELEVWDILQVGIGGYILGRSGEKIAHELSGRGLPAINLQSTKR